MILKQKKTIGWYIENRIFYMYSIVLLLYLVLTGIPVLTEGFNRTIGWLWILTSTDFMITYYTLAIYFFGFLTLLAFRKKTNKNLGKFFLTCLSLIFLYDSFFGLNYLIVGYFKMFVFLLFLAVFFSAFLNKKN